MCVHVSYYVCVYTYVHVAGLKTYLGPYVMVLMTFWSFMCIKVHAYFGFSVGSCNFPNTLIT